MRGSAKGFLALWNDHVDPDYDLWHTREHVGERLGIPGILSACRYVDGRGSLPAYFTLYPLADVAVLESAAYRELLGTPTAWSRSMRPGMRNFLRRGCVLAESAGAGVAGTLAVSLFRAGEQARDGHVLADIARRRAFSAAHLGFVDASVSGVPFGVAEAPTDDPHDAVLILECYDPSDVPDLSREMLAKGIAARLPEFTVYRLGFALERDERGAMLPFDRGNGR